MKLDDLQKWIEVGRILIPAGIATVEQFKGLIRMVHTDVTEAELNAILSALLTDALRREQLALDAQEQARRDGGTVGGGPWQPQQPLPPVSDDLGD